MVHGNLRNILFVLAMVIISTLAYYNSFDGEFVFDDSRIYNNPSVQLENLTLSGLVDAAKNIKPITRPVANLSFVFNYSIHGFNVRGYHITNLIIHILTGIILYFFLKSTLTLPILKEKFKGVEWIAFATSLVWLVHPLQTQAVSYIVQRMTSMSGLFYLLAMLLYVHGRLANTFDKRFLLFVGAGVSGVLALGSKEIAIMLPVFILLYEWFFFQDLKKDWLIKNIKVFVGVGFLLLFVTYFMLDGEIGNLLKGYAKRDFDLYERVLSQFRVIFFYLSLIGFPSPSRLSLEHDFTISLSLFNPLSTLLSIAAVILLIGCAIYFAPKYRFPAFCILWFFGNHIVEGSIIPLEMVFEHRNYLPSAMIICLSVIVVQRIVRNRYILGVLLFGIVTLFSFWTYQRNFVWHDRVSLWSDCVTKSPNLARAHNNLAVALKSKGKIKEAVLHFQKTVLLDPGFVEAYYNLGNSMILIGERDEAIQYYRRAVQLNPKKFILNMGLANALFDSYRFEEAKYYYRQALLLDPNNLEAKLNLNRTINMIEYQDKKK